jgi:hypothetical protein
MLGKNLRQVRTLVGRECADGGRIYEPPLHVAILMFAHFPFADHLEGTLREARKRLDLVELALLATNSDEKSAAKERANGTVK